jgi:hypothetical protein
MLRRERGFTLIETVIGAAIAVVLIWGLVALADRYAAASLALNERLVAQTSTDRLAERLSAEAASAWAVFVPLSDVFGNANGDGHEIDLFTEDGSHRPYAWAYRFDAKSKIVTRYAYVPGSAPVAGEEIGIYEGFSAAAYDAAAVSDPSSLAYDPVFASSSAPAVQYTFAAMPGAYGGNGIVLLHIVGDGVDRSIVLCSGTAPTSFTIAITFTPSPPPLATATPAPVQEQPFVP